MSGKHRSHNLRRALASSIRLSNRILEDNLCAARCGRQLRPGDNLYRIVATEVSCTPRTVIAHFSTRYAAHVLHSIRTHEALGKKEVAPGLRSHSLEGVKLKVTPDGILVEARATAICQLLQAASSAGGEYARGVDACDHGHLRERVALRAPTVGQAPLHALAPSLADLYKRHPA